MKIQCPASGPPDAKIVIVGEAPGESEVRKREPFVGKSGAFLKGLLASVGIPSTSCYMTNVIKERPPKNDISYFIDFKKKVPLLKNDAEIHLAYFYEEMAGLDPHIIIALGNTPLWALTENKGILKWRGSILSLEDLWPRPVKMIPALHPAACLRTYEWRHLLNFDLKRAAVHARDKSIPTDERTYIIEPSLEQAFDFLHSCKSARRVGVDIEVARREVSCISFSPTAGDSTKPSYRSISIPFWSPSRGHLCTPPQEAELWRKIRELLTCGTEVIFHNAAFDFNFLYQKYGIVIPKIQDTMVGQAILWPDFSKSLGFTTSIYTEMPYYKDEGKEGLLKGGGTYKDTDAQFWLYNAKDSVVLPEIFHAQQSHLSEMGNWETYKRQRDCLHPIAYMCARGVRVNKESIHGEKERTENALADLQAEIDKEAGYPLNPNSPKQLKQYFFVDCGQTVTIRNGKPTTDEKALKTIARRGGRGSSVASLIQDFRKLKKFSGTYLSMRFDDDGRLRSSINPVGTETGRFSSSQTIFGTGGNMQNMPYSFRVFLEPDPRYIGFEVDLSQAENRLVALLSNEEKMLEAFANGDDIHGLTASLLFSGEADKSHQSSVISPLGNGTRSQRYWGKLSNHALNYDMGSGTASLNWEIPISEARTIVEKYHRAYPALRRWHRTIIESARRDQTIINLYGRVRRYMGRWDKQLHHRMFAFSAQSVVADHINEHGLLHMWRNRTDTYKGCQLLLQIHDSIIFQIHKDLGWVKIASILGDLCRALETPITLGSRTILLPASVTMYPNNFRDGVEFEDHPTPTDLKNSWEQSTKDFVLS